MPDNNNDKGTAKKNNLAGNKNNNRVVNEKTLAEERRRRAILAVWLLMFSVLIGIFVYIYYILFGPTRRLQVESKKCLECHKKEVQPHLALKYQHEPFVKERCIQCHINVVCTKKKQAKIKGSLDKVCFACHLPTKGELGRKNNHVPFKGKRCTDCHDPHSSNYAHITVVPPTELCVSCHYGSSFTQIVQHPPAQMRNCMDCHEPHSSNNIKQLVLPVSELCYSCHFRVAQQVFKPFRHPPFDRGECTSCHKPHSAGELRLLANTYSSLCISCHTNVGTDFQRFSHHPLGSSVMPNCGKCHQHHSGDYRRLLYDSGTLTCYKAECHPDKQALFDASEHNNGVMGMMIGKNTDIACSGCHVPHGSDEGSLLDLNKYSVCWTCHSFASTDPSGHPYFQHVNSPPYVDRWHGGYMWCGSCHSFHGSYYPFMKWLAGDALCLRCHAASDLQNPVFQ